jgi:hypothetical protein
MIASITVGLIGVLLIYLQLRRKASSINKEALAWKNNLVSNGEKIRVEFKNCEIKENFYYEDVQKLHSDTRVYAFFALTGTVQSEAITTKESRHSAVVVYKFSNPRTGELQTFISPVITKDKVTLSVLLDQQQLSYIYADRDNSGNYFFDLSFLFH